MIGESVAFLGAAMVGRMALLDAGAGNAKLLAYGTSRPALGGDPGGSALTEITLTKPCGTLNTATGALTLTQLEDGLNAATGVAVWCRVVNGDGVFCFDLDAGEEGDDAEAIFVDTQLYAGGAARLVSCVLD